MKLTIKALQDQLAEKQELIDQLIGERKDLFKCGNAVCDESVRLLASHEKLERRVRELEAQNCKLVDRLLDEDL